MKRLIQHLREELTDRLENLRTAVDQTEAASGDLESTNPGRATYTVRLRSLWADEGEDSVEHTARGSMRALIGEAERQFLELNRRGDVQAAYSVDIHLGELRISVPEAYWEKHKEQYEQS